MVRTLSLILLLSCQKVDKVHQEEPVAKPVETVEGEKTSETKNPKAAEQKTTNDVEEKLDPNEWRDPITGTIWFSSRILVIQHLAEAFCKERFYTISSEEELKEAYINGLETNHEYAWVSESKSYSRPPNNPTPQTAGELHYYEDVFEVKTGSMKIYYHGTGGGHLNLPVYCIKK